MPDVDVQLLQFVEHLRQLRRWRQRTTRYEGVQKTPLRVGVVVREARLGSAPEPRGDHINRKVIDAFPRVCGEVTQGIVFLPGICGPSPLKSRVTLIVVAGAAAGTCGIAEVGR